MQLILLLVFFIREIFNQAAGEASEKFCIDNKAGIGYSAARLRRLI